MRKRRAHQAAAGGLLALLLLGTAAAQGGSYVRITPGPAWPAADVLTITAPAAGNPDGGAGPLVVTVRTEDLSNVAALWCRLRPGCEVMPVSATHEPNAAKNQMAASLVAADTLASQLPGLEARYRDAPGTGLEVPGIGGSSAGLSMFLHYAEQRSTGTLIGDDVAATGALHADGGIGAVGGVAAKAVGARAAGARVFLVPASEVAQVDTPGLRVVGVTSTDEALRWLCEQEAASSSLCDAVG